MKKSLKVLVFMFLFMIGINVKAESIDKITMDVYVDEYGDAHVTEVWEANPSEKTEYYHAYYNIGDSKIEDFTVEDEDEEYTYIDWDINGSLNDKAYHYGFNYANNGIELCFGKSSYGTHKYTLTYTIKGFVYNTNDDKQVIYWTLLNKINPAPREVFITIKADEKFDHDLPVWGYGNKGGYAFIGDETRLEDIDDKVHDGEVVLYNDHLKNTDYMTVLVKFDDKIFNTSYDLDKSFDEVMEMAEEGADHSNGEIGFFDKIIGIFVMIFNALVWFFIIFGITKAASSEANKCGTRQLDFGEEGRKLPKDVNMFRELPCGKDLYKAYWLAMAFNLVKKKTDFLGAILLKWVKDKKVEIQSKEKGMIFKKEDTVIVFKENITFDTTFEEDLYKYMYEASKDGILESKEFEKWCSSHYSKILGWFDKVLDDETEKLTNEGKLIKTTKTTLKIFTSVVYQITPQIREDAIKMKGLKEFFNEFENMKDKEAIEVNLWEEYLMYAQIFGVAEKVAKQFKELYPDLITDQTYNSMIFVNTISTSGMASASTARSRAQSYSSGGGGFSSGGGGGGSFGGGGGGFGGGSR